jgi:hypothetical protein
MEYFMKPRAYPTSSLFWPLFRWSLMSGAVFWSVVYKLSSIGIKVPDFVYVNF